MNLTAQEQQSVELGIKAQALLADQFFQFFMSEMTNAYIASLVSTKQDETQVREGLYSSIKAMQDVGATLNHWGQVKEQIFANANTDSEDTTGAEE